MIACIIQDEARRVGDAYVTRGVCDLISCCVEFWAEFGVATRWAG